MGARTNSLPPRAGENVLLELEAQEPAAWQTDRQTDRETHGLSRGRPNWSSGLGIEGCSTTSASCALAPVGAVAPRVPRSVNFAHSETTHQDGHTQHAGPLRSRADVCVRSECRGNACLVFCTQVSLYTLYACLTTFRKGLERSLDARSRSLALRTPLSALSGTQGAAAPGVESRLQRADCRAVRVEARDGLTKKITLTFRRKKAAHFYN